MAFRHYRVNLIVRLTLLVLNALLLAFLLFRTDFVFATILSGAFLPIQTVLLILSLDRTTRVWAHFFEAVATADYTRRYAFPKGAAFARLKAEYDRAMDVLRTYHLAQEKHSQYLRVITDGLETGIVVFSSDGEIDFHNAAFGELVGARSLRRIEELEAGSNGLAREFRAMKNGERKLVRTVCNGEPLQALVAVKDFILLRVKFRLVSVQNIRRELEENEIDAWEKMARVLTHEIMNSLAPITSLASTARAILGRHPVQAGPDGTGQRDIESALSSIEKRSEGLLQFTENYRKFLGLPRPVPAALFCRELFARVKSLIAGSLESRGIAWHADIRPDNLSLFADAGLLEQALINLVKNSVEALDQVKKPVIRVSAFTDQRNRPVIEVEDNGAGITAEALDQVFIPFYTTKSEGSGVGLSLCRQIMRLHHGSITARSEPGQGTVFSLRF
jgi:two-component system nitrogen regulation sensor histidine kinase NtrY